MRWLKQSTSVDVPIGPFLDSTDGVTAETALTITQPDVRLKKNNGDWAQKAAAQTLTHEENGNYEVTLDATDTNTLGLLRLHVAESGALPVWEDFMVLPANVWDSLFGADALQVHAVEIAAGLITATAIATGAIDADAIADNAIDAGAIADGAITAAKIATNAIDADALAADAVTEIAAGVAGAAALEVSDVGDLGDVNPGALVDFKITTKLTGTLTTLAGSPVVSVYKNNSGTETATGVTVTADFDSRTGVAHVRIDTAADASFFSAGANFQAFITTGTVGGNSVANSPVASFSIQNRAALRPTVADRTLDITATGNAAIDLGNVANQDATLALTATTIKSVTDIEALLVTLPDSVWDEVVDGVRTARESIRLLNASAGGTLSGAGTGTEVVRDLDDTKDRITAVVDGQGNRLAMGLDLT